MLDEIFENGYCAKTYRYKNGWVVEVYKHKMGKCYLCNGDKSVIERFIKKFGTNPTQDDICKLVGDWQDVEEIVAI